MAFSAHKGKRTQPLANCSEDEEYMKEIQDPDDVLDEKIDKLVKWIQESKHFVCFTGAGVSTSAGISDFRGPNVCMMANSCSLSL